MADFNTVRKHCGETVEIGTVIYLLQYDGIKDLFRRNVIEKNSYIISIPVDINKYRQWS